MTRVGSQSTGKLKASGWNGFPGNRCHYTQSVLNNLAFLEMLLIYKCGITQRFPPSTGGSRLNLWFIVCSFLPSTVRIQTVASINAGMHSHAGAWERERHQVMWYGYATLQLLAVYQLADDG